jgi:hypothetical protein
MLAEFVGRGDQQCHTVKNVVLVDKQLTIQFLSPTHPGTVHEKRIADTTPYPLPCRILKDVCRLLRKGMRDLVMEIGCALHNFRLHLDPWLPIPESE